MSGDGITVACDGWAIYLTCRCDWESPNSVNPLDSLWMLHDLVDEGDRHECPKGDIA